MGLLMLWWRMLVGYLAKISFTVMSAFNLPHPR